MLPTNIKHLTQQVICYAGCIVEEVTKHAANKLQRGAHNASHS